ncbi:CBS domain-containing protein [Cognatiluteimonas lumbrici]|uniref:CBS domain-containing protein n=1 Tax=Cognatiluteimonas lumbrici TaxID=2559601 RepID=UPI001128C463|nr:CBS domain-containing protein [Luteimonas lumbrici]
MELDSVMTANPACCRQNTPLRQVAQMMADNDCGMIPVVDEQDVPVGVITDRDIAVRAVAGGKDTTRATAADYMTTPVRTVVQDSTLADCVAAMEAGQVRRIPVVGADGKLCGVVAQADIALTGNDQVTGEVVQQVSKPS